MNDSWEENQKKLQKSSEKLLQRWKSTLPKTVIMCGSGWTKATEKLEVIDHLSYESIDCLTPTTVEGHKSNLLLVKTKEAYALIFQGRKHFYEGEGWEPVINPILLSKKLGCDNCVLTNAAGGINTTFKPGDLVIIDDHINLTGRNPLIGKNNDELGPRFPDMTFAYNKDLRQIISEAASSIDFKIHNGVYAAMTGPSYETPAEIKMLRVIGADMVGMSTVFESIAGNHAGLKVAGISCITNMAAGIDQVELKHEDIKEEANKSIDSFCKILEITASKL